MLRESAIGELTVAIKQTGISEAIRIFTSFKVEANEFSEFWVAVSVYDFYQIIKNKPIFIQDEKTGEILKMEEPLELDEGLFDEKREGQCPPFLSRLW